MPTSTSFGADACVVVGIPDVDALRRVVTYGLAQSVSDYCFYRCLEKLGKNPNDYKFQNRDPEQAAQSLVTGSSQAAQLWNPFTLQTVRTRKDAKVLLSSTMIPDEVVDMVLMDNKTLHAPGGDRAAKAICETFYSVCDKLKAQGRVSDDTYVALGDQFSNLPLPDMMLCADMGSHPDASKTITTRFYDTPELGQQVFRKRHMDPILAHVIRWAKVRQIIQETPLVQYADAPSNLTVVPSLTFDGQYMATAR
jgi:hypothetical protein